MNENEYIQLRRVGRIKLSELRWLFESYSDGCDCEFCNLLQMQKDFNFAREQKENQEGLTRQQREEERIMNESDD